MLKMKHNNAGRNVFVYGTLMYDVVLHRVIKGKYEKSNGTAKGFRRLKITGEDFPGMVPASETPSLRVTGIVLQNVSPDDVERLDIFEAACYSRETIKVMDENNNLIEADTYIVRPDHYYLLDQEDWDTDLFEKEGLKRFSDEYYGFDDVSS